MSTKLVRSLYPPLENTHMLYLTQKGTKLTPSASKIASSVTRH